MYSVVILTRDEAVNIGDCIASIPTDDIVVLDSHSTDDTCDIASAAGAAYSSGTSTIMQPSATPRSICPATVIRGF